VTSYGDDRPDHFKGEPSDSLEQALSNFSGYNRKLADILKQDSLSAADLHRIHQLSYTLENALAKISAEIEGLEELLEEVHIASETAGYEKTLEKGREYISLSQQIIRP